MTSSKLRLRDVILSIKSQNNSHEYLRILSINQMAKIYLFVYFTKIFFCNGDLFWISAVDGAAEKLCKYSVTVLHWINYLRIFRIALCNTECGYYSAVCTFHTRIFTLNLRCTYACQCGHHNFFRYFQQSGCHFAYSFFEVNSLRWIWMLMAKVLLANVDKLADCVW